MSSDASETKYGLTRPQAVSIPPVLSGWLSVLLNKAAQQTRELFEHYIEMLGLRSKSFAVLALLSDQGPLSQVELGRQLHIDRATMVEVIDDLDCKDMVKRIRNLRDRRLYAVTLTPYGLEVLRQANTRALASEEEYLAPLTQEQREQLRSLLKLLLQQGETESN